MSVRKKFSDYHYYMGWGIVLRTSNHVFGGQLMFLMTVWTGTLSRQENRLNDPLRVQSLYGFYLKNILKTF